MTLTLSATDVAIARAAAIGALRVTDHVGRDGVAFVAITDAAGVIETATDLDAAERRIASCCYGEARAQARARADERKFDEAVTEYHRALRFAPDAAARAEVASAISLASQAAADLARDRAREARASAAPTRTTIPDGARMTFVGGRVATEAGWVDAEVTIDFDRLVAWMGGKATRNGTRRARALHGIVDVRVTRPVVATGSAS